MSNTVYPLGKLTITRSFAASSKSPTFVLVMKQVQSLCYLTIGFADSHCPVKALALLFSVQETLLFSSRFTRKHLFTPIDKA